MAIVGHLFRPSALSNRNKVIQFTGSVKTGATGAISTSDTPFFTVTKVAATTGRYLVTLIDSRGGAVTANKIVSMDATVETTAVSAAYTAAKAIDAVIRNNTISTTGTFQVQFIQTTNADAEVEDNATFHLDFSVKFSSV